MTTIHFAFCGLHAAPLPHMCCACGKAHATGVISYTGKVHEPHCEECCKAWEAQLRFCTSDGYIAGLEFFRKWQAVRRTE